MLRTIVALAALVVPAIAAAQPAVRAARTVAKHAKIAALAIDSTHVYFSAWAGQPGVFRVPRGGGPVEPLTTTRASEIAVTRRYVWWVGERRIERLAKGGTRIQSLRSAIAGASSLVAIGDDVWFVVAGRAEDAIYRFRSESASAVRVAALPRDSIESAYDPAVLAGDAGAVFIAYEPLGLARLDHGRLAEVVGRGAAGRWLAAGGDRIAVGRPTSLTVRSLDGAAVATASWPFISSGIILEDGLPNPSSTSARGASLDAVAGGGGRNRRGDEPLRDSSSDLCMQLLHDSRAALARHRQRVARRSPRPAGADRHGRGSNVGPRDRCAERVLGERRRDSRRRWPMMRDAEPMSRRLPHAAPAWPAAPNACDP